jgi:hypothetical protein
MELVRTDSLLFGTSNAFGKIKCHSSEAKFITYDKTIFSKLTYILEPEDHYIVHNDYTNNRAVPTTNIAITGYSQHTGLFLEVAAKIPKYLHLEDSSIREYIHRKYGDVSNGVALGAQNLETLIEIFVNALDHHRIVVGAGKNVTVDQKQIQCLTAYTEKFAVFVEDGCRTETVT